MNNLKASYLLLFILISTILFGCKGSTGPVGPTGPGGPSLTGKLSGLVTLIDTNGIQPTNRSGVSVTIDGLSKSAMTDSTGKWVIDTLSTGIYAINIS